uniref:Si:ch211-191i18.2 n=1 Tax=Cyprinus carpio TaxID=7962 RepID=A0A8C1UMG4_CYPCA
MAKLPHLCVMISLCLSGALLLLPLCLGVEDDQYYDYDSNSTYEYSFFSNVSSKEQENFFMGEGMASGGETSFTEIKKETDGGVHEEKPTEPTIFDTNQVFLDPLLYFLTHYNMLNTQNSNVVCLS